MSLSLTLLGTILATLLFPIQEQKPAILTGHVSINYAKEIKLSQGSLYLMDAWINRLNPGDSLIALNNDGTFEISLPLERPDFFRLTHEGKEARAYLTPGDSLHVDFTKEDGYSGPGAAANVMLEKLRNKINSNRRFVNGIEFYNQSPEFVYALLDSLQTDYLSLYKKLKKETAVNEVLEAKVLADIEYRNKLYKVVHPPIYKRLTGNRLPVEDTYYEKLAEGSLRNPELLKSIDYVLFLEAYVNAMAAGENKFDNYFDLSGEKIHSRYQAIANLDASQEIIDYLLYDHLNKSIDNYGVAYLEDLIADFRKNSTNAGLVNQVSSRYEQGLERRKEPDTIMTYKTVGDIALEAHVFYPDNLKPGETRPTYLFFHGGGWAIGIPEWGYEKCKRFSEQGMIAISFEYRLIDIHGTDITDCIEDAKSAIRWAREETEILRTDPDSIVAAGFSAGGHLAAATAIIEAFEPEGNSQVSTKPNAIVVHSASYNTSKSRWFSLQSNGKPESISTYHNLDEELVPAIFFHGTRDHLAPIAEFQEFKDKLDSLGHAYDYKIFEGVGHFFNSPGAQEEVDQLTESFLKKLEYIPTDKL